MMKICRMVSQKGNDKSSRSQGIRAHISFRDVGKVFPQSCRNSCKDVTQGSQACDEAPSFKAL
jgi:hypothetical protein